MKGNDLLKTGHLSKIVKERLYDAIGEMLLTGAEFENAYSLVIAAGDVQATTWIKFCVQCATRFDDTPEESEFLAVLEEFSRKHV